MLPNLIIIGAMKCGTTSLHKYLDLHPEVSMSRIKEPEFFYEKHNWQKGPEWYESLFPEAAGIRGESSTCYSKYPIFDGVPEKMHSLIPGAKLIYIVRDPIQRIISQYIHKVANPGEKRSLEEILVSRETSYIYYSKYYMQIERYLDYYPKSRILVIDFDELVGNRLQTLRKIFEYLDIDPHFKSEQYSIAYNQSGRKVKPGWLKSKLWHLQGFRGLYRRMPGMFGTPIEKPLLNDSVKKELQAVLKPDAEKLRAFSGCSFSKWSI